MFKKVNIKKIFKELAIYLFIIFLAMNLLSYIRSPNLPNTKLPNITSKLIDNSDYSSSKQNNKALLIHFWATWCPTCKLEADNIQKISEDFNVITIAVKSKTNADIQEYLEKNNFDFKVINDNDAKLASKFLIPAYPTTFIYNKDGNLEFSEVGYNSYIGLYLRMWWANR